MPLPRRAISLTFAVGIAVLPLSAGQAQYYYPCDPFPLAWPFCIAGAAVGTAAAIATAPFYAPYYYYGRPYYYASGYYYPARRHRRYRYRHY